MKPRVINHNGKKIAEVYLYTDYKGKTKEEIIDYYSKIVEKTPVGYAGWKKKAWLKEHIDFLSFGKDYKIKSTKLDKEKIFNLIKDSLTKCYGSIDRKPIRVFVFPTFSEFVRKEMGGIMGTACNYDTMTISIIPTTKWQWNLKSTILHEFNHIATDRFNFHNMNIRPIDGLIYEGLAEHFREQLIGGEQAPWSSAVPRKKCKEIFSNIKNKIDRRNNKLYFDMLYGDNVPQWTLYSLGYQITKDFLKKNPELEWDKIVKIPTKTILRKSGWI